MAQMIKEEEADQEDEDLNYGELDAEPPISAVHRNAKSTLKSERSGSKESFGHP